MTKACYACGFDSLQGVILFSIWRDPPLSLSLLVQLPILDTRRPHRKAKDWKIEPEKTREDRSQEAERVQSSVTGRLPGWKGCERAVEQKEKRIEIQNSHQLKLLFPWRSWKSWLWLTWWPRLNHLDCCSPGPNRWNNVAPLVFFSFFAKAAPAGRQQEPLSGRHAGAFPKKTTLLWSCVGELFTLQKGRRAGFWSQTVDFFQSGHSWFSKPTFWKQTMIGQRSVYFYCLS